MEPGEHRVIFIGGGGRIAMEKRGEGRRREKRGGVVLHKGLSTSSCLPHAPPSQAVLLLCQSMLLGISDYVDS